MPSPPPLTPERLFATPELFPVHLGDGVARFVPMTRASYERSIFLDQRLEPARRELVSADLEQVRALHAGWHGDRAAASFIFHTALCGSTLLARALEIPARSLVLREPMCLRALAVEACQTPRPGEDWHRRLGLLLALLSRSYAPTERALVKANIPCNFILPEILAGRPGCRGVLLYQGLRPFLAGVLRWAEQRDGWMRALLAQLAGRVRSLDVFAGVDLDAVTRDVHVYACVWLAQIDRFRAIAAAEPDRVRTLDSEDFYREPRPAVEAALRFLGVTATPGDVDEIMGRAVWSEHAKFHGSSFDDESRRRVLAAQYERFSESIDEGIRFASALLGRDAGDEGLGSTLIGEARGAGVSPRER